jgi:sulfonate transport system ATP-binding protein
MPWLRVTDNVAFGLPRQLPRAERARRAAEEIARVGLARFADALPKTLSGGMAQRAALARALVTRPSVLLLDEPFSALDALTRQSLQEELVGLWERDRPTMVLVTHDLDEALFLADRVVVLGGQPGRIRLDLPVPLPRPRPRDAIALAHLRERLFAELPHGPAAEMPAAA